MSDELYFDVELKKCLNTAAFSDDLWDWWYQRIHQAHDASVDRVTDTQRAENAKLRELVKDLHALAYNALPQRKSDYMTICSVEWCIDYYSRTMPAIEQRMRELGIEVAK